MNIKRIIIVGLTAVVMTLTVTAAMVTAVTACQRYPWNGLVDITVTLQGTAEDMTSETWFCRFAATNSATHAALPVVHVMRNGADVGSASTWTRKFIWDAAADVGATKIDDVTLTVEAKPLGSVQLWEDGPYWAECNVGATNPEECGYYFWWGDTVGYKRNASDNGWVSVADGTAHSFRSGNCPTFGKDNSQLQSAGYIDSTGNLVAKYDAATAYLGSPWRMPTDVEISALVNKCTTTWMQCNGVWGRLVTGKDAYSSKSIFLPAAGFGSSGTRLDNLGTCGFYSSATPYTGYNYWAAWHLEINSGDFSLLYKNRYDGLSVRPVRGFVPATGAVGGMASTHLSFDGRTGDIPSNGTAELSFSSLWDGDANATVTITCDGVKIFEGLTGEGTKTISFDRNGWYGLEHTTYTNGVVSRVETASFVVTGKEVSLPNVVGLRMRQRYPWNGLVDIDYELDEAAEGSDWVVAFAATNKVDNTGLAVTSVWGLQTTYTDEGIAVRGRKGRVVWDAQKDLPSNFKTESLEVTIRVVKPVDHLGGVQLWANGPYWAQCNVGAIHPEDCGYYFWWGDTVGYTRNASNNGWVSVADGTSFSFSSENCLTYGKNNSQLQSDGYIDATGNLVAAHDAATVHLGAPWRMPTDAEFSALISNCTTTWIQRNGVWGRLVMGKGAFALRSIFLPAAGLGYDSSLYSLGSYGYFWSSTPYSGSSDRAWRLYFGSGDFRRYDYNRYNGQSVRPVRGFAQ